MGVADGELGQASTAKNAGQKDPGWTRKLVGARDTPRQRKGVLHRWSEFGVAQWMRTGGPKPVVKLSVWAVSCSVTERVTVS